MIIRQYLIYEFCHVSHEQQQNKILRLKRKKNMKSLRTILTYSFIIISFSCKKTAPTINPLDFNCNKTAKISSQWLGGFEMVVSYENGKIIKVAQTNGAGFIENYSYKSPTELVLTRNFSDNNFSNTIKLTLNEKGYIVKFVQEGIEESTFSYDVDGFVKTSTHTYPSMPKLNSFSTYIYANGNLIQIKNVKGNVLNFTIDYTYYEDKLNKADVLANQNQPDMYGKISKNLVKKITYTYVDEKTESYEYTYEQNSNGFVKSLVEKYTDSEGQVITKTNRYEYICL